jgi:hypothetical protein
MLFLNLKQANKEVLPYPKMKTIVGFIANLFSQQLVLRDLLIKFQLRIIHVVSTIVTKMDSFDLPKKIQIIEIALKIMAKYAEIQFIALFIIIYVILFIVYSF